MSLFKGDRDYKPIELAIYASAPDEDDTKHILFTYDDDPKFTDPIKRPRTRNIEFAYRRKNEAGFVVQRFVTTAGVVSYHRTPRLKGLPSTILNLNTYLIDTQPQGFYGYLGTKLTRDLASIALSEHEENFYTVVPMNFRNDMPGKLHEPAIDWPV